MVCQKLTDAISNADTGFFQFKHTHCNAVNIQHNIRTFVFSMICTQYRHFLSNCKIVVFRIQPIDIVNRWPMTMCIFCTLTPITEQRIDTAVDLIQGVHLITSLIYQLSYSCLNLVIGIATLFQICRKQIFLDWSVIDIPQISDISVAQIIFEPMQDSAL